MHASTHGRKLSTVHALSHIPSPETLQTTFGAPAASFIPAFHISK